VTPYLSRKICARPDAARRQFEIGHLERLLQPDAMMDAGAARRAERLARRRRSLIGIELAARRVDQSERGREIYGRSRWRDFPG